MDTHYDTKVKKSLKIQLRAILTILNYVISRVIKMELAANSVNIILYIKKFLYLMLETSSRSRNLR